MPERANHTQTTTRCIMKKAMTMLLAAAMSVFTATA